MSVTKKLMVRIYKALEVPRKKKEWSKIVIDDLFADYGIDVSEFPVGLQEELYGIPNIGFGAEAGKKKGIMMNTAKCKDANEGLYAVGTWYRTQNYIPLDV